MRRNRGFSCRHRARMCKNASREWDVCLCVHGGMALIEQVVVEITHYLCVQMTCNYPISEPSCSWEHRFLSICVHTSKMHRLKISIGCITIFMGMGLTPLFMRLYFLFYHYNPTEGHWLCRDGVRWQVSLREFWHGCVASSDALWTFFHKQMKSFWFFSCVSFFPYYNCLSIFHCLTKQRIWFGQTSWSWNKSS